MHFDVAAFDLEISPLGGGEDLLFGACRQAGVGAGEGDFLVGRRDDLAALGLGADFAGGSVEMGAGFGVGLLVVLGFSVCEEGEAVLDGEAVVALADELGVVAADDRGALAGDEDVIVRGELGDAAGGAAL